MRNSMYPPPLQMGESMNKPQSQIDLERIQEIGKRYSRFLSDYISVYSYIRDLRSLVNKDERVILDEYRNTLICNHIWEDKVASYSDDEHYEVAFYEKCTLCGKERW